jgi:hypothetical protein
METQKRYAEFAFASPVSAMNFAFRFHTLRHDAGDYLSSASLTSDNHRIVAALELENHDPRNRFAEQVA